MSKKETKKQDEFENVEQVLSASEAFIEKNQKTLLIAVGVLVLAVLLVLSVRSFYLKPREIAAENEIYKAQVLFAEDLFDLALHGDSVNLMGFEQIADKYSSTATGNLARAYAGICYFNMKQYEDAIKSLESFKGKDDYISASVLGLIGDSYVELDEKEKAVRFFEKASKKKNDVISPIYLKKAGLVYESLNELSKAEKCYIAIKDSYSTSQEAADIDKYIARVQK